MDTMKDIILACITFHNMKFEDERDTFSDNVDVDYYHVDNDISNVEASHGALPNFTTCKQDVLYIRDEFINNFK